MSRPTKDSQWDGPRRWDNFRHHFDTLTAEDMLDLLKRLDDAEERLNAACERRDSAISRGRAD